MKLNRPRVPISVRVAVAQAQLGGMINEPWIAKALGEGMSLGHRLRLLLGLIKRLLGVEELELHHDPALGRRLFNKRTGKYKPDANDARFLIYLPKADHLDQTAGRGGDKMRFGGDTRAIAKVRRIEREGKFKVRRKRRRCVSKAEIRKAGGRAVSVFKVIAGKPRKFIWPKRDLRSRNNLRSRT